MRVAGIRFINALPLLYGLKRNSTVELTLETPSICYRKLIHQEVDVALVPSLATQMNPALRAVKGLGIAATNRTESVYLFCKKAPDRIETVLADESSLSSVLLLRIVLKQKYKCEPSFQSGSVADPHQALRSHDAVLIIGDEAILSEKTDYDHYDLATEWHSVTGLPFVFALWACCRTLDPSETDLLTRSYLQATQHTEEIYSSAAEILPVDRKFLKRYYNENLHYQLNRRDYEGLLKFFSLAAELGYLESVRKDIWL